MTTKTHIFENVFICVDRIWDTDPLLPRPTMLVATLRSEGGDGGVNVAEKVNQARSFNLHRDYFKSLTFSNLGEPS